MQEWNINNLSGLLTITLVSVVTFFMLDGQLLMVSIPMCRTMITGFSTCFVLGIPSFCVGNPLQLHVFKLTTQKTLSVSASHLGINLPFCSTLLFVIFHICDHDIWKCFRLRSSTVNHRKNESSGNLTGQVQILRKRFPEFHRQICWFCSRHIVQYPKNQSTFNKYVIPIHGGFVDHFHSFSHT